jgi:hypothetical protein
VIRYDFRINLPPSESGIAAQVLGDTLRDIFSQLWNEDSHMVIYPWSDTNLRTHPALVGVNELPASIGTLRRYFSRINPRPAGGQIYVLVRLGLNVPMSDIMESAGWWLKDRQHGFWPRAIQAEETVTIGWLLYSTRSMDLNVLQDKLLTDDPRLEVGLRWRLISLGQTGPIPKEQQVRAIHVEADKNQVDTVKPILYQIYGTSSQGPFPNGVKMRLVPEITPLMGPHSRAKIARLRNRQANFVEYSMAVTTWEIATLDYHDQELGASLRDLIVSIRAQESPQQPLFHSVDAQWQGNGFVVTFLPNFESEARTVIAGFIPFLQFHHPDHKDRLAALFTPSAVKRASEASWDPVAYAVITADDGVVDGFEDIDHDMDICPPTVLVEGIPDSNDNDRAIPSRPDPGRLQGHQLFGDLDSVSTIDTRGTKGRSRPRARSATGSASTSVRSSSPSASSRRSSASSVTLEDRVSSMEAKFDRTLAILERLATTRTTTDTPSSATGSAFQDHPAGHPVVTPGTAGDAPPLTGRGVAGGSH